MMDRLTQEQSAGYDLKALNGQYCNNYCDEQSTATCRNCAIYQAIQKLAHYEDMEEQGKLLILPCNPGDTVYIINALSSGKKFISKVKADTFLISITLMENKFGKTVFMTEQEAKEALEGMKK